MQKYMEFSYNSRYLFSIFYIFALLYKVLLAGQYLVYVPDHFPVLLLFPLSVIFAASDFILLYLFFRIFDLFSKFRVSGFIFFVLFLSAGAFYLYDFSIFQYFRGFSNFGLNRFLVYDSSELSSYFIFSLNLFLAGIILFYLFSLLLILLFLIKNRAYIIKPFSDRVLAVLLAVNVVFCIVSALCVSASELP